MREAANAPSGFRAYVISCGKNKIDYSVRNTARALQGIWGQTIEKIGLPGVLKGRAGGITLPLTPLKFEAEVKIAYSVYENVTITLRDRN